MNDIPTGAKHFYIFPHSLTGRLRDDFTIQLFKDADLITSVPVEIRETTSSVYVASFTNDGTNKSTWTIIITDPSDTSRTYSETWYVRADTIETILKQLRTRQDNDPAFTKRR